MSRLLLLLPFLIWMSRPGPPRGSRGFDPIQQSVLFLGVYVLLVAIMGVWARVLARDVSGRNLQRSLRRFNRVMLFARIAVAAWFAVGFFHLDWDAIVRWALPTLANWPVVTPLMLIGTLPAFATWVALWWAQFPADLALKEQGVLSQLENDIPVYHPQRLGAYLLSHLRLQILFTLLPVLMILIARDAISLILNATSRPVQVSDGLEAAMLCGSTFIVFIFAPELLRRILKTRPLPGSPLRDRLEALCVSNNLKYRDILLWETSSQMGNAAVMGIVPQMRYILLSDLLLETMTDEQVEAVFAHELGHIVHRHMAWYVVVFLILFCAGAIADAQVNRLLPVFQNRDLFVLISGIVAFILTFGFLSRRFERQADVFAARTVEQVGATDSPPLPMRSFVGRHGAAVFGSALRRVAVINNIPTEPHRTMRGNGLGRALGMVDWLVENANHWLHGSIESRVRALHVMSTDPGLTNQFDRRMLRVYLILLCVLGLLATWMLAGWAKG